MITLRRLFAAGLALVGLAATAPAQFPVPTYQPQPQPQYRNPFPSNYPTPVQQPVYSPPPVQQPVFVPPVKVRPRVPVYDCLDDFARNFHACPGHHHVIVVHPVTRRPVEIHFDLPDCRLRDVDVNRRSVEFDYGKHEVEIVFNRDGTVCVHDGHGH